MVRRTKRAAKRSATKAFRPAGRAGSRDARTVEAAQRGEVVVYEAAGGAVRVEVRLENESVWLTQQQMAQLFGRERSVVAKHIQNVFREGELVPEATCAKYAQVRTERGREVERDVEHYNLDVIISVGYRVNSKRGTQFRIWATKTLREHLLRGFTLNERRLRERGIGEIDQAVRLLSRTLTAHALVNEEGRAVLDLVAQYTRAWQILLAYDEQRLPGTPARPVAPTAAISVADARSAIAGLRDDLVGRGEAGSLFGQERGDGLDAILGAIEQSFGGQSLYPSAQVAQLTCSTSSSRTIRSAMGTSGSERSSFSTTFGGTAFSRARMAASGSRTPRWSRSLCSWRRASRDRRSSWSG